LLRRPSSLPITSHIDPWREVYNNREPQLQSRVASSITPIWSAFSANFEHVCEGSETKGCAFGTPPLKLRKSECKQHVAGEHSVDPFDTLPTSPYLGSDPLQQLNPAHSPSAASHDRNG
jgi:hypothetical protein